MRPRRALLTPSGRPLAIGRTVAVGHRGARAFAPENTLPAFAKAAALGCAMVELDVHPTRDGELVVHHDDRLARCTDVALRYPERAHAFISEFDVAELRTLDAGRWFARELALPAAQREAFLRELDEVELAHHVPAAERLQFAAGAVRIPILAEVLTLARRRDLMLNIEIKAIPRLYEGVAAALVAQVRAAGLARSVLVSSFDHEQLLAVRALDAEIATGVLTGERLARPADYLRLLDADAYHPCCSGEADSLGFGSVRGTLDTRGIEQVRAAGGMVFAWTCNRTAQMRALCHAGVSGIITDYPNRFPFDAAG